MLKVWEMQGKLLTGKQSETPKEMQQSAAVCVTSTTVLLKGGHKDQEQSSARPGATGPVVPTTQCEEEDARSRESRLCGKCKGNLGNTAKSLFQH